MTTKKGVWNLQQVRDKQLQSLWDYAGANNLYTWGTNAPAGALGLNDEVKRSSPTQVPGTWASAKIFRRVGDSDQRYSAVIKSDGTLWNWGINDDGQLGQNSVTPGISSPVQVGSDTTWSSGSFMRKSTAAIKTDGTLWSWGYANWGILGQNDSGFQRYSSPVQIPGTTWKQVGAGHLNCFGVKTDGTLWYWGNGHWGKLGNNKNQNDSGFSRSSPTQLGSDTTWECVSGCGSGGSATKTDGTLWTWGGNDYGVAGWNTNTRRSSPTQVPGTTWGTTPLTLTQGDSIMFSIKTDGTLWGMGFNNQGQLGDNSTIARSSPIQVPGTTWRSIVQNGGESESWFLATKTDGTLWAWGANGNGQLGQNSPANAHRSSPVQIGSGTGWTETGIGAGGDGGAAIAAL